MARTPVCIDVHKKAFGLLDGVEPREKVRRLDADGKPKSMSIDELRKKRPGLHHTDPVKHKARVKTIDSADGPVEVRRALCITEVRKGVGMDKQNRPPAADEPAADAPPPPAKRKKK